MLNVCLQRRISNREIFSQSQLLLWEMIPPQTGSLADTEAWYGEFETVQEQTRRAMTSSERRDAKEVLPVTRLPRQCVKRKLAMESNLLAIRLGH
jgi:hypothetical protein